MKKLFIASRWNEKDLKSSWAGTSFSLFNALSKIYSVQRIQVEPQSFIFSLVASCSKYFNKLLDCKFLMVKKRLDKCVDCNVPILMYPCLYESKHKFYVYRDNTYEIFRLYNNIKENNPWPYNNLNKILNTSIDLEYISDIEQRIYEKSSGIFFMGEWIANYMKSKYPFLESKIYAVGGGINFEIREISPNRTGTKILFVGKDFQRKGGYLVLDAFKLLKLRITNAELFILGPELKPYAGEIEGVSFLGKVNFDVVSSYMSECDCFCMPSYFEAYGLVFVEALCMGLPCIGRDCWEMPYFIEEGVTGELLKSNLASELSCLMEKILGNKQYEKNVISKRDYFINKYSWKSVAERISDVIN